jgi:hypothetical protein
MATLNTAAGWVNGDEMRVLIASGLLVSGYHKTQMIVCMNEVAALSPTLVGPIQDLLDQFEEAQANMTSLNASGNGKTLIKADVLEWEASQLGTSYSPEREISRIQGLLYQYFGSCPLYQGGFSAYSALIRS